MRLMIGVLLSMFASAATAFQPRTGHWWNPAESGRGFNIDIQDGVMVMTMYAYDQNGNAQWYLASANMTNGQHNFSATLDKYAGGQCASCAYSAPAVTGNDGVIGVTFVSEVSAVVTLPGGRTTAIQPLNFKYGDPPQGLLGEWVYVYDIISTFADRFDYTVLRAATPNGTGTAWDDSRDSVCEFQISGVLGGNVACVQFNSTGGVVNSYLYNYGVDETFSGQWISLSPEAAFPMKGFRIKGASGFAKSALGAFSGARTDKAVQLSELGFSGAPKAELAEMARLAAAMRATKQ